MAATKLKVTGMTCDHCKRKVEGALQDVPGAYAVVVDLEPGLAEVDHSGDVAAARLIAAVVDAGYGAEVA